MAVRLQLQTEPQPASNAESAIMHSWSVAMRTRHKIVTILKMALLLLICSHVFAQSKTEVSLQKERANLEKTSDPVSRTKIEIKISATF